MPICLHGAAHAERMVTMRLDPLLCRALCLAMLVSSSPTSRAQSLIGIDVPSGIGKIYADGISGDGRVVTGQANKFGDDSFAQGFRWTAEGGTQLIATPPGYRSTTGTSLSFDGTWMTALMVSPSFQLTAARWSESTGFESLHPAGEQGSSPYAISQDGKVVVGQAGTGNWHGFRWTAGSGTVALGGNGDAHGMSSDGMYTVGTAGSHAVRWHDFHPPETLQSLDGASYASASDASLHGDVVVGHSNSGNTNARAVRWLGGDAPENLGTLVPNIASFATAVSDDGAVVVGNVSTGDLHGDGSFDTAFIWDSQNGMRGIADVLTGLGVNTDGWRLYNATGISADGKTIVGRGVFNGDVRGWVATVPSPSVVLPVSLVIVRRWRHRADMSC